MSRLKISVPAPPSPPGHSGRGGAVRVFPLLRPLSLSTPMWTYRSAGLRLHAEVPVVACLGLVHHRIPIPLLILGGIGCRDVWQFMEQAWIAITAAG